MIYDLCIVGAGMFGSAAARHASLNPALKIALVGPDEPKDDAEKRSREIFSAHYDEGRITRVLDEQLVCQKLGEESIKRYRELEAFSGLKFYHPIGMLAFGQKGSEHIEHVRQVASLGKVPTLELEPDLVKIRYPFLHLEQDDLSYLDENGAGHISPRKMAAAQRKVAEMQGCKIIRDIVKEVTPLKEKDGCFYHELITENGQTILAKRVIISTGAFVNLKKLVPNAENKVLDLAMIPDTAAMVKVPDDEAERLKKMPDLIYYGSKENDISETGHYVIPPVKYPDGYYIKVGHLGRDPELKTVEDVRRWYLSQGNQKIIESRTKIVMKLLPDLKVDEIKGLACVICVTASKLPYIDRVSPTLTVAVGGNGKSARASDEIGRLAAELSVYGRWDSDIPRAQFKAHWKDA